MNFPLNQVVNCHYMLLLFNIKIDYNPDIIIVSFSLKKKKGLVFLFQVVKLNHD